MILRRLTRPTDRHMGLVYGEDPRPVQHHSGPHAGHTVVTVQGVDAEGRLMADGWERVPVLHAQQIAVLHDAKGRPVVVPPGEVLQATEVLPADPAHPLDPATGMGEGRESTAVFDGVFDALNGDEQFATGGYVSADMKVQIERNPPSRTKPRG